MLRWRKLKINDILNEFLILNDYEIFYEKFIVLLEQFIYQLVLLQKLNHKNLNKAIMHSNQAQFLLTKYNS